MGKTAATELRRSGDMVSDQYLLLQRDLTFRVDRTALSVKLMAIISLSHDAAAQLPALSIPLAEPHHAMG